MDDADFADPLIDAVITNGINAARQNSLVIPGNPTQRCYWCDAVVGFDRRWCDATHRDLWQKYGED